MKPTKTLNEQILFLKYYKWLHSDGLIPQDVVNEYLTDLKKTKKMRKIIDFIIATIGCISDNNYICAGVLVYLLIRLKQEFDGEAINP